MRKFWVFLLLISIVGCISGCSKEEQENPTEEIAINSGEYVYVPKFYNLGEVYEPDYFEAFGFGIRDDELIYAIRRYSLEEPIHMHKINIHTGEATDVPIAYERDSQMDNYAVGRAGFDGADRLHIIYELVPVNSDGESANITYEYRIYGASGELESAVDVTEYIALGNKNADITTCIVTKTGDLFWLLENTDGAGLIVLSKEGLLTRIDLKNERLLGMQPDFKDGCILLMQNTDADALQIGLVDAHSGEVNILCPNIPDDVIGIIGGNDEELLLTTEQKLVRYSVQKQTSEEILNWKDYDVRGEQVCFGQMLDGNNIYLALSNGMYNAEMLHLSLVPKAEVQKKEVILLATPYSLEGSQLGKEVASYNKYNGKYQIKTAQMEYENGEYLLDGIPFDKRILGDQCPDLVPISQSLDWEKYASNGVFEDLSLYLDQSPTLQRDDLQENILSAYTCGDKLLCIPSSFSFTNVLVGKESLVGGDGINHISDIQAILLQNQKLKIYDKNTRSKLLYMGWKSFVNLETRVSEFDSAEFISFLEWLNTYTDEINTEPLDLQEYQDGNILFREVILERAKDCSVNTALFGEKVILQGYPGWEGASIAASDAVAILANGKQKNGAWDFVEYCMRYKKVNALYNGFPTRKDMMKELLDQEVLEGRTMKYYIEGVEIPVSAATQEEIDMLQRLVNQGCVAAEISRTAENDIYNIVTEEIGGYFTGQKSASQVAEIIHSRVQLYLAERW